VCSIPDPVEFTNPESLLKVGVLELGIRDPKTVGYDLLFVTKVFFVAQKKPEI
jgi:hypothetical protein